MSKQMIYSHKKVMHPLAVPGPKCKLFQPIPLLYKVHRNSYRIGWPTRSIMRPNMQLAPETKCLLANHGNMHQLEALQV